MAKPASLMEALTMQMNPELSLQDLRQARIETDKPNPPPAKRPKYGKKGPRKS